MKKLIPLLVFAVLSTGCALLNPAREHSIVKMTRIFHPAERVENHRGMENIFPFNEIAASSAPVRFAADLRPLPERFSFENQARPLKDYFDKTVTTGVVVVREGKLVHENYFHGAHERSRFTSWSIAKSFVATLVGVAMQEGKIGSLDDPLGKYIPELAGDVYETVTIRAAMLMSSGVLFDETYDNKLSDINKFYYKVFIFGQSSDRAMLGYSKVREPMNLFSYIGSDTQMLSWLLRTVYGQSLAQIVQQKLWQPLGMEHAAYWSTDQRGGREIGFCCLNATARDFAKLGQLYLQDGMWNGVRLLPDGFVKMATRPNFRWQEAGFDSPLTNPIMKGLRGYGMQFWVPRDADGEYYGSGVWGQTLWIDEKTKSVVVRMAVDQKYREHTPETFAVMRALAGR
jgi:CubicO group peptidase (beta-lactamase class C family)